MNLDAVIAGGRSSGSYTASAVHFDGSTWLVNSSLTATDNDKFYATGWFKVYTTSLNSTFAAVDPQSTYTSNIDIAKDAQPPGGGFFVELCNVDATKNLQVGTDPNPSLEVWHSFVMSAETNFGIGSKVGVLYVDDVNVSRLVDASTAFTMKFNGLPFWVGNDGLADGASVDVADIRIVPGTSLITAGDIPLATRRLFVSATNKPVNPATATASLGTPCILFSGNASAFATNQGNGGAFTTTGALTNASTSPSS